MFFEGGEEKGIHSCKFKCHSNDCKWFETYDM